MIDLKMQFYSDDKINNIIETMCSFPFIETLKILTIQQFRIISCSGNVHGGALPWTVPDDIVKECHKYGESITAEVSCDAIGILEFRI